MTVADIQTIILFQVRPFFVKASSPQANDSVSLTLSHDQYERVCVCFSFLVLQAGGDDNDFSSSCEASGIPVTQTSYSAVVQAFDVTV